MECPRNLFLLTRSDFSCRIAKFWFQNIEVFKSITKGCPQGSTSGPGFWNIVFNSCLKLRFEKDTYGQGFADDLLLKSFAKSTDELEGKVNKALELFSQWAENNKLEFNASKITAVLFTKNLKFIEPKIKLYNQELKLSNSFKYLGVIIDKRLNWKEHIFSVKTRAQQLTMQVMSFAKNKFGLNARSLEIIFKGAIIPILSYGSPLWIQHIDKYYIIKLLESIQRLNALRLCRAYKTVSKDALNIIANFMPIDLVMKQRAIEYFIKHGIDTELSNEYFRHTGIDLLNIQKPYPFYDLPHPALTHKLNRTRGVKAWI
jgi:hypothetical protein